MPANGFAVICAVLWEPALPAIVFSFSGAQRGAQQAGESGAPFLSRPCGLPSLRNPPGRDRPEG